MIQVIIAGAGGRMGCRLTSLVKESTFLTLSGAVESKGHRAVGEDAGEIAACGRMGIPISDDLTGLMENGEVVIDFSVPSATLDPNWTEGAQSVYLGIISALRLRTATNTIADVELENPLDLQPASV